MTEFCGLDFACYAGWLNSSVGAAWVHVIVTILAIIGTAWVSHRQSSQALELQAKDHDAALNRIEVEVRHQLQVDLERNLQRQKDQMVVIATVYHDIAELVYRTVCDLRSEKFDSEIFKGMFGSFTKSGLEDAKRMFSSLNYLLIPGADFIQHVRLSISEINVITRFIQETLPYMGSAEARHSVAEKLELYLSSFLNDYLAIVRDWLVENGVDMSELDKRIAELSGCEEKE